MTKQLESLNPERLLLFPDKLVSLHSLKNSPAGAAILNGAVAQVVRALDS